MLYESLERKLPRPSMAPPGNVLLGRTMLAESSARVEANGECIVSELSFAATSFRLRTESHLSIERTMVDMSYRWILRGACGVVDVVRVPNGREIRLPPARPRLGLGEELVYVGYICDRAPASGRGVSELRKGDVTVERDKELSVTGGKATAGEPGSDELGDRTDPVPDVGDKGSGAGHVCDRCPVSFKVMTRTSHGDSAPPCDPIKSWWYEPGTRRAVCTASVRMPGSCRLEGAFPCSAMSVCRMRCSTRSLAIMTTCAMPGVSSHGRR